MTPQPSPNVPAAPEGSEKGEAARLAEHEARIDAAIHQLAESFDQPSPATLAKDAEAMPEWDNNVAWLRYDDHNGRRPVSLHICNPDDPGSFMVYRRPASPARAVDEALLDIACRAYYHHEHEVSGKVRAEGCIREAMRAALTAALAPSAAPAEQGES